MFCNDDKIISSKIAKLFDIIVYIFNTAIFLATHIAWQSILREDNKLKAEIFSTKMSYWF